MLLFRCSQSKAFVVPDNDRTWALCLREGFVYHECKTGLLVLSL